MIAVWHCAAPFKALKPQDLKTSSSETATADKICKYAGTDTSEKAAGILVAVQDVAGLLPTTGLHLTKHTSVQHSAVGLYTDCKPEN